MSKLGEPTAKWINLNALRELAYDVRAMGIDLVSLANNHTMDFRVEGMLDSRRAVDEADVFHAGAGRNLTEASAPAIVTVQGRTIAFLSVACTLPLESAAGPN